MKHMRELIRRTTIKHLLPIYRYFSRIHSQKVYDTIDPQYVESDRIFFYWNRCMFVNAIRMESAPWTYETILLEIQKILQPNSNILDYWCGAHKSAYLRSLYGPRVSSADILDLEIDNFYKINPKDSSVPIEDGSFDIVIASEVIEHVFSPFVLLDELIRISREYVIISTPNPASLRSRRQFYKTGFLSWFWPDNWNYHLSPVFYWQVEKFLQEKKLNFKRIANHSFYDLNGDDIENAEVFIYIIKL